MTISTMYTPNTYAGDGSTVSFAITFEYLSLASNIKVSLKDNSSGTITEQVSGTHYNVSGSNVVFLSAPAVGKSILVELNVSFLQQSDYRENGSLPAELLESDLDARTLESQLNKGRADAALRLDPIAAATLSSNIIKVGNTAGSNAGKYVRFNASGTGFEVQSLADGAGIGAVVDDSNPALGGDLTLNGNEFIGAAQVTGVANAVQLKVVGHTTQTANILEARNNAGGLALGVDTSGNAYINGNVTVGGTVDGRDVSVDGVKLDGITAGADPTVATLGGSLTAATVAADDLVLIKDTSASGALRTVTTQSIANLAAGGSSKPTARAYRTTSAQSFSASTYVKVQLNAESFDTANCFDSTTNYRFTPNVAGYYNISARLTIDSSTSMSWQYATLYKNGSRMTENRTGWAATGGIVTVADTVYLNGSSDYIEVYVYVIGGSALTLDHTSYPCYATFTYAGS